LELLLRVDEVETRQELLDDSDLLARFVHRNVIDFGLSDRHANAAVSEHEISIGDLLIVCSDGLNDNLTTAEIAYVIEHSPSQDPQVIATALCEVACARSQDTHVRAKPDDISVACLAIASLDTL
jgi:serine/threonine protein phosphatase PrpC